MSDMSNTPPLRGRVVVGFDGSGPAERALERAVEEAVRRKTGLEILCGAQWAPAPPPGLGITPDDLGTLHRGTREMLQHAAERARKLAPGLSVTHEATDEDAVHALVRRSESAALVVLGTRGHGGFTGLLLGSVSMRVAAHAKSPVMVVRGDRELDEQPRGTVLVAVQANQDKAAVQFSFEEAARHGARLRALHAWLYPAPLGGMPTVDAERVREQVGERRKHAEAVARYAVAPFREDYPGVEVIADHECRSAAGALVEASKSADVVVLTAHRNPHRLGMQLGPVTHAVLHHAHCPVVLIPAG